MSDTGSSFTPSLLGGTTQGIEDGRDFPTGIHPGWSDGPVLTDDQMAAALASPHAALFGGALVEPIPPLPASMDANSLNPANAVITTGTHAPSLQPAPAVPPGAPDFSAGFDPNNASIVTAAPAQDGTFCPPVLFKVTGIGPGQANDKSSYTHIPGKDLPNGAVAVNPENFGVPRHDPDPRHPAQWNAQTKALTQVQLYPDWSAAAAPNNYTPAIPRGLPSAGPYAIHDALSPPTSDNHIDLYRYGSRSDAMASTRNNVPIRAWIPGNDAGLVKCPPQK